MSEWEGVVSLRIDQLYGTVLYERLGYWLGTCVFSLLWGVIVPVWGLAFVSPGLASVFDGHFCCPPWRPCTAFVAFRSLGRPGCVVAGGHVCGCSEASGCPAAPTVAASGVFVYGCFATCVGTWCAGVAWSGKAATVR